MHEVSRWQTRKVSKSFFQLSDYFSNTYIAAIIFADIQAETHHSFSLLHGITITPSMTIIF